MIGLTLCDDILHGVFSLQLLHLFFNDTIMLFRKFYTPYNVSNN